ncbi:MAG: hypothetical protein H6737_03095 [Alphaproteobacteria bacterium]|nr:hypothetical protein [Alphaproteobacteria bacterium]
MSLVLFLLLGCEGGDPVCREGTALHDDGHCYPPLLEFPPQIDDALDALPACEPLPVEGAPPIDIGRGCASGACANDTFAQMVTALGDDVDCVTTTFDAELVYCTWGELGIDGLFEDDDRDDEPDPGARTDRIHLFPPYTGATIDGVGIGANVACFLDSLGHPERLLLADVGGEMMVREMFYDGIGMVAQDLGADDDSGLPNGFVDHMYLYGQ